MVNRYIAIDKEKRALHSFDSFYTDYHELDGAGVYLGNDVVLVDFDGINKNEEFIIQAIENQYPTLKVDTKRGSHFYFKKPRGVKIPNNSNYTTLSGLKVDFKTGNQYGIIKIDGKERPRNRAEIDLETLLELPLILYPYSQDGATTANLEEGQGRNSTIFKLLASGYGKTKSPSAVEELGRFINEYCFSEKLEEKEFQNVLNSVLTRVKEEEGILPDEKDPINIAIKFANMYDVHMYKGFLYFKKKIVLDNGKTTYNYVNDDNELDRIITSHVKLKTNTLREVRGQLLIYSKKVIKEDFYLKVRNGIISEDGEFIALNEQAPFTPFYLDVEYDKDADNQDVNKFIEFFSQGKADLQLFLIELLGHLLMIRHFPPILLFMVGAGANGKSTFVEMITSFLGELSSHIDITGFEDDTQITSLIGKLANISDDIDPKYVEKSQKLKTMASGNTITVRPIYREPLTIVNTATLLFTCNELPTFRDKTHGMKRRAKMYPCERTVVNKDPYLLDRLKKEQAKSALLNLALLRLQEPDFK